MTDDKEEFREIMQSREQMLDGLRRVFDQPMTGGTHKDLSDIQRARIEGLAEGMATGVHTAGQSLAIARQAMIDAFDAEAARLMGEGAHNESASIGLRDDK